MEGKEFYFTPSNQKKELSHLLESKNVFLIGAPYLVKKYTIQSEFSGDSLFIFTETFKYHENANIKSFAEIEEKELSNYKFIFFDDFYIIYHEFREDEKIAGEIKKS